ncbi:serine hydrolase domain-containing protein [Lacticaseibacillus nasuensis]|uniref:serine hydrolase domain-containing protein n=1 Tax=Lacticaseibacillus nasuensis TaxID=944671 RepID=UPI00224784F0|nr:serine hydrolase domain-containing protein [Lacticaseibacillus nasuensis]MCX2455524.1 beta-lactamase family protein [Lacticaseibacillus nasuensis]
MVTVWQQLNGLVNDRLTPGVSAAVDDGARVTMAVFGEATWQPTVTPLRSGALYDLASLTKVLGTTNVFLQALAAGRVGLDQPLREWLPAFTQPTTFRQALTHTSGLEGYIPHRDDLPPAALRQALLTQLHVDAGECDCRVVYRDVNLLLVGWALEAVYHESIQALITARVLRPLGLTQATFTPAPARCVPTTYASGQLLQGRVHDPKSAILGAHSGAAGLFASLQDLIRFSHILMGVLTTPAWLKPAWLLADFTRAKLGRSLGWDLRRDAAHRLWLYHTGYTGGFWLVQPTTRQALIVLTNRVHPKPQPEFLPRRDAIVAAWLRGQA